MSESRAHDWKSGLQRVGTYYEGYIDNLEPVLEDYRRDTVTSWGTQRSSSAMKTATPEEKENIPPCTKSKVNARVMWSQSSGGHTVEFNTTPFRLIEKKTLDCQFGKQYYKDKPRKSTRTMIQGSRKLGCPAHITIKVYETFPEYSISETQTSCCTKKALKVLKEQKMKELKLALTNEESVLTTKKYFVSLPSEEAHEKSHPIGAIVGVAQKMHPTISKKIESLVREGTTDGHTIQRVLKEYVNTTMSDNPPCRTDRAYYPTVTDINNHVTKAKSALQLSKLDQQNLHLKVQEWEKTNPDAKHYFQPYRSTDNEESQSLLWVHQEKWQRDLLIRYGNTLSLMDATYKTTKYDLPLFFLCVRTNTKYMVVAEFIVQSESAESILEAINIIKQWNPAWNPKFFLCDYSDAEIAAIEQAFPGILVYLCDFHREQAWTRWIHDRKHGLSASDGESLLSMLRACAWASPGEDGKDRDYYYQQHVNTLVTSQVWKQNPKVAQWLNGVWLKCPQRWSRAFRDDQYHAAIDTSNGVEAQNKLLKYSYMPKRKPMTLSGIVGIIVECFLPDAHRNYILSNVQVSEWYRKYKDSVPSFLHGRPRNVVLHCLDRQAKGRKYDQASVTMFKEEGCFEVKKSSGGTHRVDFGCNTGSPSCSCKDWIRWHIPCKHFFGVFIHYNEWSWNSLPKVYLDSSYLSTDKDAISTYFTGMEGASSHDDTTSDANGDFPDLQPTQYSDDLTDEPPKKKRKLNLTLLAMKTRANLQRIQSLTYAINDEHAELLQDMNSQLQHLYDTIYQQLPNKEGLALRTNSSIRVSTIRRKVRKSRSSLNCSRLNTTNPKKRSRPLGTSKRVGIRADRLRKAHQDLNKSNKQVKGRKVNCGNCDGCLAQDCGKCTNCRDKVKFGGPGRKKQKCQKRKCIKPTVKATGVTEERDDPKAQKESKTSTGHSNKPSTNLSTIEQLLASQNRKLVYIRGDGNCLFRALSLLVYGSEMYHQKIRELLVNFVRTNADKFRGYVNRDTTLEDHLLHMQYSRTWATQVELYAAASLFGRELYVYTPTVRVDEQYIWTKVSPLPSYVVLAFPPKNEPWPKRLDEIDHIELCHTSGIHFDVIADLEGKQCSIPPNLRPISVS